VKPHSRTWQGHTSVGTVSLGELLEACHANIRAAASKEAELRALWDRLSPGDPRFAGTATEPPLGYQIRRARIEQGHWREYQRHYLQRIAIEGQDQVIRVPIPRRMIEPPMPPPPGPDRRLPREIGDDDGDELPF
jgi:hypothetical protein